MPMSENTLYPKYRPDIDGLRAIAVLSVVFYHAFPSKLTGGFLGVDIFFVISGFLISTILFQNIDRGSFSIGDFYSRRIRRIFPALGLVLISVLAFAWFCLFPDELQQLGKHTASSAGFIQNFTLWKEAGYFDNASETKPLLHIWSLGIEEQFYFVWPLLLWGASKVSKIRVGRHKRLFYFLATVLVFLVSFILNLKLVTVDPTKTFYLPQYRFFELALGGLLSWWVLYQPKISLTFADGKENFWPDWLIKKRLKNILSFVGLAILLVIFRKFNKETVFPGKNALLPIFAAAFIIWAGPHSWLNRKILSHKILVWFGLISYPLYLWHWPILSLGRIIYGEMPTREFRLIAVAVSVLLAWLTVKIIEKPFRFGNARIPLKLATLCLLVFGVGGFGKLIQKNIAVSSKNSTKESGEDGGDKGNTEDGCGLTEEEQIKMPICKHDIRNAPSVAIIGDSKAGSLWTGLVRYSTDQTRLLIIGGNGKFGSPNPYWWPDKKEDSDKNPLVIAGTRAITQNKKIRTVIITLATREMFRLKNDKTILDLPESKNFDFAFEKTVSFIRPFIDSGKKVIITVDNPTLSYPEDCAQRLTGISFIDIWSNQKRMKNICSISYDKHLKLSGQYRRVLNEIQKKFDHKVFVFDILPFVCDGKNNQCAMTLNNRLIYRYTDHLSDYASGLIAKELIPYIEKLSSTTN